MLCLLVIALISLYYLYNYIQWKNCNPRFVDKVVLITGGSSGIGEALAKKFNQLGAKVVITARRIEELERVKRECADPSKIEIMKMDLSKPQECLKQVQEYKLTNRVDILINNGGLSMREEFINTSYETCEYMMNTNCMSHIALIKGFLPMMIQQKSGHIVNILSISGLMGVPVRTMYCASKFAMDGFSKSMRSEVAHYGIHVTNVYPAYIQTNISKNAATGSGQSFGKLDENISSGMPVEKAVEIIIKAIGLKYHEIVVGKVFYEIIPKLCFISSWLNNLACDIKYKSQLKVMQKAK